MEQKCAGNTSTAHNNSKHRAYMLTINNPTINDYNAIKNDDYQYCIYQVEKVETLHIQMFIYYSNPRVWPKKKYPTAHIEPARNIKKSIEYCSKEESRVCGPYEFGTKPEQGHRSDLDEICELIKNNVSINQIAMDFPATFIRNGRGIQNLINYKYLDRNEAPKVMWLWGSTGKGKTRYAYDNFDSVYIKDGTMWWDNYTQQECIVIDDFDGKWPFRDLLRLLDRYPYQGQFKGGYIKINSPNIIITCEFPPSKFWQANELAQIDRRLSAIISVDLGVHDESHFIDMMRLLC